MSIGCAFSQNWDCSTENKIINGGFDNPNENPYSGPSPWVNTPNGVWTFGERTQPLPNGLTALGLNGSVAGNTTLATSPATELYQMFSPVLDNTKNYKLTFDFWASNGAYYEYKHYTRHTNPYHT